MATPAIKRLALVADRLIPKIRPLAETGHDDDVPLAGDQLRLQLFGAGDHEIDEHRGSGAA